MHRFRRINTRRVSARGERVRGRCCTRGRRGGGRNEEMTKGNEQPVFVQNTPDGFPAPLISQDNDKERLLHATQYVWKRSAKIRSPQASPLVH